MVPYPVAAILTKLAAESSLVFDLNGSYPKLAALHAKLKAEPALASYFASDAYCTFAVNNPQYANYVGSGYGSGPFGPTIRREVTLGGGKGGGKGKGFGSSGGHSKGGRGRGKGGGGRGSYGSRGRGRGAW